MLKRKGLKVLRLEPRDQFDKHIIGLTLNFEGITSLVYDEDSIIEMLAEDFEENKEDSEQDSYILAVEYFEFNIRGAYLGKQTPIFVSKNHFIELRKEIK